MVPGLVNSENPIQKLFSTLNIKTKKPNIANEETNHILVLTKIMHMVKSRCYIYRFLNHLFGTVAAAKVGDFRSGFPGWNVEHKLPSGENVGFVGA